MRPRSTFGRRNNSKSADRLTVGFVPTIDCATLIAAKELGLFEAYGLDVQLSREVGWATIREKLLHEELDAVAAHASVMLSIHCGIGVVQRPCLTGLILAARGSAITLSNELWELGARDAATTGAIIRSQKSTRRFVFGIVLQYATQHYLLNQWLNSAGLDPETDVTITVIPSALIYDNFSKGFLDGYCVAEPWNSAAVNNHKGWIPATAAEFGLDQPEKVLLVLHDFAEQQKEAHLHMLAALISASRFCADPTNRTKLVEILAKPAYFDVPAENLHNALVGPFETGRGVRSQENFINYDAATIGAPTAAAGRKIMELIGSFARNPHKAAISPGTIEQTFRKDIYDEATCLEQTISTSLLAETGQPASNHVQATNPVLT